DAGVPGAVLGAGGNRRAAPGALVRVDPGPDRTRSVLHPAGAQHAGHVADAEADAGPGHGPDAAEDDAVHAAGGRRDDGLLPVGPGAVLGHQRRAGPAAAVVDDQAPRRVGHAAEDRHREVTARHRDTTKPALRRASFFRYAETSSSNPDT